jgi:hypothetical protein
MLYEFSKFQQLLKHYLRHFSRLGPWKFKIPYRKALGLWIYPQENLNPRNVVLRRRPAAVRPNSGEAGGRGWLGVGEGWPGGAWARFEGSVEGEELSASPLGGAAVWRPRRLGARDEGSTGWTTSNTGSTSES